MQADSFVNDAEEQYDEKFSRRVGQNETRGAMEIEDWVCSVPQFSLVDKLGKYIIVHCLQGICMLHSWWFALY